MRRAAGTGSVSQRQDGRWIGQIDLGYRDGRRHRKTVYGKTREEVEAKIATLRALPTELAMTARHSVNGPVAKCSRCQHLFPLDDLFREMCGGCYPWGKQTDIGVRHPDRGPQWRKFHCTACSTPRWTQDPTRMLCVACSRRSREDLAREADERGTHTAEQWEAKLSAVGCCVYCGSPGPLTIDHATPLTRGGDNTIENVVPACLPCNASKGAMTAAEFIRWKALQ